MAEILAGSGRLIAVDCLPMASVAGVEWIQGDFTEPAVLKEIRQTLGGQRLDLVISDMAPNMSGVAVADQLRSMGLVQEVLGFASQVLAPEGALLTKVFQGRGMDETVLRAKRLFTKVALRKPEASRRRSDEIYLLARGFRGLQETLDCDEIGLL